MIDGIAGKLFIVSWLLNGNWNDDEAGDAGPLGPLGPFDGGGGDGVLTSDFFCRLFLGNKAKKII